MLVVGDSAELRDGLVGDIAHPLGRIGGGAGLCAASISASPFCVAYPTTRALAQSLELHGLLALAEQHCG